MRDFLEFVLLLASRYVCDSSFSVSTGWEGSLGTGALVVLVVDAVLGGRGTKCSWVFEKRSFL